MEYYYSMYARRTRRKNAFRKKSALILMFLILAGILWAGWVTWNSIIRSNVWLNGQKELFFTIPANSTFEDITRKLYGQGIIINRGSFELMARLRGYPSNIKPGGYLIKEGMTNFSIVNMLRSGRQTPVRLIFNNIRTKDDLVRRISLQLAADSTRLMQLLNDSAYLSKYNVSPESALMLFIPNTYEFYWNTSAEKLIERMYREQKKFWTESRKQKAKDMQLTLKEVFILASIVEKETNRNDEKPKIAGVYMNRLRNGWLLQADPTLVYALGDYSIHRVWGSYTRIDSPYNTYLYKGLPPGPICIPSIASIDAVLNYEKNDFNFFCAREDLSGYHNFAIGAEEHSRNAAKYQQALNKLNIRK